MTVKTLEKAKEVSADKWYEFHKKLDALRGEVRKTCGFCDYAFYLMNEDRLKSAIPYTDRCEYCPVLEVCNPLIEKLAGELNCALSTVLDHIAPAIEKAKDSRASKVIE